MELSSGTNGRDQKIVDLFAATFAASDGVEEGALVSDLARKILDQTADEDFRVFTAIEDDKVIGCIVFTRLTYAQDDRVVFVLGPVAVATDRQGKGIGQKLLRHGLSGLRVSGVDVAVTYGDPKYYSKVGFAPMTEDFAQAPFLLQYPEGWLGQSLTGDDLAPLEGPSSCVAAFDNPAYW